MAPVLGPMHPDPIGSPRMQFPSQQAFFKHLPRERLGQIGLLGAYLFSFFAVLGTAPATMAMLLFLVAFLFSVRDWGPLVRDPLFILFLLFSSYVLVHSLVFYLTADEDAVASIIADAAEGWLKPMLVIPFAYWAAGRPDRINRFLLLALLGFTLGLLRKIDWAGLDASFFQTRFEDYLPANAFGLFAALGILGLLALRERFWGDGRGALPRWLRIAAWGLLLAVLAEGLVLSFSRGSWLGFLIAAALLLWLEIQGRRHRERKSGAVVRTLVVVSLALLLISSYWDEIEERVTSDNPAIAQALDGNHENLRNSSIGIRLNAWGYALDEIRQHPWFGQGAGSSGYGMEQSGRPELMMGGEFWLTHLHNSYLEVLYQFGLVGFALLGSIVWALARGGSAEYRAGRIPRELYGFLLAALVLALLWNLVEYRTLRHDWRAFWIIVAGSAYSFHLRTLLAGSTKTAGPGMQAPNP